MRISILAALAFAGISSAQNLNQSAPFNLILLSSNSTLNGTGLSACHEGAAIESLCVGGGATFTFNYTASNTVNPAIGIQGVLTYELRGGNFNLSSPMMLSYNPTSNVALPIFTPGNDETQVAFDCEEKLTIPGFIDDTLSPPNTYAPKAYSRWYICETYYGYLEITLAWAMGDTVPQNPSCQKVEVVRVFV